MPDEISVVIDPAEYGNPAVVAGQMAYVGETPWHRLGQKVEEGQGV